MEESILCCNFFPFFTSSRFKFNKISLKFQNVKIKDREEPSELSDAIYKQMASVTIMVTQLVVEFAKHLPGFMTLNRDDQIVLLKVSNNMVMVYI